MIRYPFLVSAGLFFTACGPQNPAPSEQQQDSTAIQYFPVRDFLASEIAYVDSTPVGIMQYTTRGKVSDSGYIQPEVFHRLAAEFIPEEIKDPVFRKEFEETSFLDKSSNAATFFYSSKNKTLDLKRVDVVTAKGDVYDQVKSIYLEKNYQHGDSLVVRKLYWKPKRNFQIITISTTSSGEQVTELIKVVWDNRE